MCFRGIDIFFKCVTCYFANFCGLIVNFYRYESVVKLLVLYCIESKLFSLIFG